MIVTCMKLCPDPHDMKAWLKDPTPNRTISASLGRNNRVLLEASLQLSKRFGQDLTAIAVCDDSLANRSRIEVELRALGVDYLHVVALPLVHASNAFQLAHVASKVLKHIGTPSLVLTADQFEDDDSPFFGPALSHCLDMACLCGIRGVESWKDNGLVAIRETNDAIERYECETPLVLGVSVNYASPHICQSEAIMLAHTKPVRHWTAADLGVDLHDLRQTMATPLRKRTPAQPIERLGKIYQYPQDAQRFADMVAEVILNET